LAGSVRFNVTALDYRRVFLRHAFIVFAMPVRRVCARRESASALIHGEKSHFSSEPLHL
jgi:hypothetical protein